MAIKSKIIILLIIFITIIFNFNNNYIAKAVTHNNYKESIKVDCGNGVYINFDASTFDEPVEILCVRQEQNEIKLLNHIDQILSPMYYLEITSLDDHREYNFFRKEATINFPKNLLFDQNNLTDDLTIFFYDLILHDWVSYNTSNYSQYLQAKLMHTGNFAVFSKAYDTKDDIYKTLAFYLIIVGIGVSLIYVIIKK